MIFPCQSAVCVNGLAFSQVCIVVKFAASWQVRCPSLFPDAGQFHDFLEGLTLAPDERGELLRRSTCGRDQFEPLRSYVLLAELRVGERFRNKRIQALDDGPGRAARRKD